MKKKITVYQVVIVVFSIVFIIYFVWQIKSMIEKPYETQTAILSDYSVDVELDGYFAREEVVLKNEKENVVAYMFSDGEKVKKGTSIAEFYASEQDLINLNLVKKYEDNIKMLEDNKSEGTIKGTNLDLILEQVRQYQIQLIAALDGGDLSEINIIKNDFTNALNKLEIIKGKNIDYESTIKNLESKKNSINVDKSVVIDTVTSEYSGYFCTEVDGMEEDFNLNSLENLSLGKINKNLKKHKTANNKLGKIVIGNEWYYVSTFDSKYIDSFYKGQAVYVNFTGSLNKSVRATVSDIIFKEDEKKAAIVVKSDYIDAGILNTRFSKAYITINNYKGVVVNKDVIRFQDGEKGVYILVVGMPSFKKVDVIYENDDIVISRATTDTSYLSQYDQVIVKGKNLNDQSSSENQSSSNGQSSSGGKSSSDEQ